MKVKRIFYAFLFVFAFAILASCQETTYQLTVDFDSTKGNVTYTEANYKNGYRGNTNVTISVNPFENFEVDKVTVDGNEVELENQQYTFVINKNMEVIVEFKENVVLPTTFDVKVFVANEDCVDYKLNYNQTSILDGKFIEGSKVELAVELKADCKLNSIKVNGEEVELTDEKYQFIVNQETTIVIDAVKDIIIDTKFNQSTLDAMLKSFEATGAYRMYYTTNTDEIYRMIQTIFEEDKIYQKELDLLTGEVLYDLPAVNHNGLYSVPFINLNNEVVYTDSEEPFDDYDNPFKDLTVNDFEFVEEGKFKLINKQKEVAMCLTGWKESIASFYVNVENGLIVSMEITTELIDDGTDTYYSVYNFEVFDYGTAETGIIDKPYEKVAEHEVLEKALAKITNNFTVNHLDIWEGYDDVVYNVYVGEKAIYAAYYNGDILEGYGYVELDGFVYPFEYDGTVVTISDALSEYETIEEAKAKFQAFNVALLKYEGNETYVARTPEIASAIAMWIGEDYDTQMLGQYVNALKIILKDGELYQITFDYLVYGYPGTVVLTYSDVDKTVVDIDFSDYVKVSVLDPFVGTWLNDSHKVVITKDGITIDGEVFEVVEYDKEYDIFVGTVNGETRFIQKWTDNELAIYDENGSMQFIVGFEKVPEKVVIPEKYKGVWVDEEGEHKAIVQTNVIIIDGEEFKVLSYTEYTGLVGQYKDATYWLVLVDDEESTELFLTTPDLSSFYSMTKTNETYIEIPEKYVGTWKDAEEKMTVEITFMGIMINGLEYKITSYNDFEGFTGTYNGIKDYMIAPFYSDDKIQIGTMAENYVCQKVEQNTRPSDVEVQEEHIGTYKGTAENGTVYEIVVTKEKIMINGVEYVLTAYDEYEGYTGTLDGAEFYLMYVLAYGDDPISMYLFNETYTIFVQCPLQEETGVEVNPNHYGTYVGSKNDITYTFVLSADGLTLNGDKYTITSISEYDEYVIIYNNDNLYISYYEAYQNDPASLIVVNEDYSLYFACYKQEGDTPIQSIIDPSHVGTYKGTDNGVEYVVVITEEKITINGEEFVAESYTEMGGYVGKLGNEAYTVVYCAPFWGYPAQAEIINEAKGLDVYCDIVEDSSTTSSVKKEHMGTYKGIKNDVEYVIVITEEKIMLNGAEYAITKITEYGEYVINYNDADLYILYNEAYNGDPASLFVSNMDYTLYFTCYKQEGETPVESLIDPSHVGTYKGTKNDVEYVIVVTEDKIMVNGVEFVVTDYDDYEGYTGIYNGEEYYMSYYETSQTMNFMSGDFRFYVQCELA